GMLGISTGASVCVSEPPVAPIVCASRIGEKRIPEAVKVPVTLFENVIDVPEMTVILVPLGNFGCDANMPTARPAADATVPVAVPVVMLSVVETCVMFDAEPLALSRPTAIYARLGMPNVVM